MQKLGGGGLFLSQGLVVAQILQLSLSQAECNSLMFCVFMLESAADTSWLQRKTERKTKQSVEGQYIGKGGLKTTRERKSCERLMTGRMRPKKMHKS